MRKLTFIAVLAVVAFLLWSVFSKEETSVVPRATLPSDIAEHIASKSDLIRVEEPAPLATVSSPLVIRGEARGQWFFEATFPVILVNWDGLIIAEHYAEAKLDPSDPDATWMTENFVPFEAVLSFENPSFPEVEEDHSEGSSQDGTDGASFSRRGTLILQKSNASGLPEHDDALEIPVLFEMKPAKDEEAVFCTADAKLCPDGTWVGRTGPNCEFVCSEE